jgi:hypothetical protein
MAESITHDSDQTIREWMLILEPPLDFLTLAKPIQYLAVQLILGS